MRMDWAARASCQNVDPDLFFDETDPEAVQIAKEICGGCVVQKECLHHALVHREKDGIWAGTTPAERKRIRKLKVA